MDNVLAYVQDLQRALERAQQAQNGDTHELVALRGMCTTRTCANV